MRHKIALVLALLFALTSVSAQSPQQTDQGQKFQPAVGQAGKDVIWVPTPEELVAAMLDAAKVTAKDFVMDLGSGDGRIVIAAAKRGARALGIEYNPDMVALSRQNAQEAGVSERAAFRQADIFETDFSQATVVTMYLLPDLNMRLRDKVLGLKPGTRIVSHSFDMGDWEADETINIDYRTAYLWIVPAKAAGTWTWTGPKGDAELTLVQTFQKLEGKLKSGGTEWTVRNPKLDGDRLGFSVEESASAMREYAGQIKGDVITGTSKAAGGASAPWSAKRAAAR
jgi:SAM-dependent methyltransferase